MPKLKVNYEVRRKAPPIDWLWAAVLERKMVLGYNLKDMAEISGIAYETMRRYATKSPWDWPRPVRDRVCERFGIAVNYTPSALVVESEEKS